MTTIRTFTGQVVDLEKPHYDTIDIIDIAHAASQTVRYNGHVPLHYSVAQHCVLAAERAAWERKQVTLLHDAAESYIHDITRPCKTLIGDTYKRLERSFDAVIFEKFTTSRHVLPIGAWSAEGCNVRHMDELVKTVDNRMLVTEQKQYFGHFSDFKKDYEFEGYPNFIHAWDACEAAIQFLKLFTLLTRQEDFGTLVSKYLHARNKWWRDLKVVARDGQRELAST